LYAGILTLAGRSFTDILPNVSAVTTNVTDVFKQTVYTGNFSIWRILHWLTTARLIAYHKPNQSTGKTFLEYDDLTSDLYAFIASAKAAVSKDLYSLLHEPGRSKLPTLAVRLHLGYIGTSSLNTVPTLINHETGAKLARKVKQVIIISALC